MSKGHKSKEDIKGGSKKAPKRELSAEKRGKGGREPKGGLGLLQRVIGNRAVGRLVQRKGGDGGFTLDEDTTARINRERGSGQALDRGVQEEVGGAMGVDFSDVNVHTSAESDDLNKELGAKAFTTGKDIFFRESEYDPHSSSGKELISHELTHVAQQGSGQVRGDGSGDMAVGAPGDRFEREADEVAKSVAQGVGGETASADAAQRQPIEEEEEMMQPQPMEEEEEMMQPQPLEEEEEMILPRMGDGADLQRQELPEEEEVQMQELPEEEEVQMQDIPEEEEVQMKRGDGERASRT